VNRNYREVFNECLRVMEAQGNPIYGKDIAQQFGWHPSKVSRFLSGKGEINTGEFFELLNWMPPEFQALFWHRFIPEQVKEMAASPPPRELALTMNNQELSEFFAAIAERHRVFPESNILAS